MGRRRGPSRHFAGLQARMTAGRRIRSVAERRPAQLVAFDVLAADGEDLRGLPLGQRRTILERALSGLTSPIVLCQQTTDLAIAEEWSRTMRPAGVEGLVAKAADGRYDPGKRAWVKIKNRQTRDVICAAVTGTLQQPRAFVAGLAGADGRLVIAGRGTVLTTAQAAQLAAALTPAGSEHPWPEQISNGVFGTRDTTAILRTEPVVVEVYADTALSRGRFRHTLRYIRVRPELSPQGVPALPTTG